MKFLLKGIILIPLLLILSIPYFLQFIGGAEIEETWLYKTLDFLDY